VAADLADLDWPSAWLRSFPAGAEANGRVSGRGALGVAWSARHVDRSGNRPGQQQGDSGPAEKDHLDGSYVGPDHPGGQHPPPPTWQ
jgi:hypothetical protein